MLRPLVVGMATDWNDTGYHEIRLEHKQLAIVFFIAVSFGVVLFLLGVWVGRNHPAQASSVPEAIEKVEQAEPKPLAASDEPTFFKKDPVESSGTKSSEPPAKTAPTTAAKPKGTQIHSIQAGAFSTEENAKKMAVDLEKAGYVITIASPDPRDQKKLYRVLVGEFGSKTEAEAAKKRLESMGFKKLVVK